MKKPTTHFGHSALKGASAFAIWLGPFVRVTRDAGFGDSMHPVATFEDYPALLGGEPPRVDALDVTDRLEQIDRQTELGAAAEFADK